MHVFTPDMRFIFNLLEIKNVYSIIYIYIYNKRQTDPINEISPYFGRWPSVHGCKLPSTPVPC
jgi:hypothetical protein